MLGRKAPYFYELELEKFKYSQEVISTGVSDIDVVVTESAYTLTLNMGAGTGTYTLQEIVYQSPDNTLANANVFATVQTWTPSTKVLTVSNIKGAFSNSVIVIGETSNAQYAMANTNDMIVHVRNEIYDNLFIENSGNINVDTSESNPFGSI